MLKKGFKRYRNDVYIISLLVIIFDCVFKYFKKNFRRNDLFFLKDLVIDIIIIGFFLIFG